MTAAAALTPVVLEIERHVAEGGWDQPPRLFALAPTADLVAREPRLAAALGLSADDDGLTPIEQEEFPVDRPLDEALARIGWPTDVVGCALVVERIVLPPTAEAAVLAQASADDGTTAAGAGPQAAPPATEPASAAELARLAATHPGRHDVRMAVVVLRSGERAYALRLRDHDRDDEVLTGADLVPGLGDALAATLRD